MKAQIIKIGNSRGIRIPKPVLAESNLDGEVELEVIDEGLLIKSTNPPRHGWEKAFQAMAEKAGIKIKSVYYTQGQYDMVAILEGPDEAAMVALLNLSSLGNARFQTMRGYSVDEMNGFISKMK